jgi:hypothetical protein
MIRRAITVLGDEGIHGADEAIEHLRKALHLGDDFEEHG